MYQSALAVWVIRGVSFESFMGPVISARKSCMPPTPSMGNTAMARTMMPMPPNHWSCWRYNKMERGRSSSPSMTVAPVVVKPERDSNTASVTLSWGWSDNIRGKAPYKPKTAQNRTVTKKPSRIRNSARCRRTGNQHAKPVTSVMAKADRKALAAPSR